MADLFDQTDSNPSPPTTSKAPLADQMRPTTLDQFVGQQHLMGEGKVLLSLLLQDALPSMILWGPPGSGKTTLARLIASQTARAFKEFSAVTSSISDIKQVVEESRTRLQLNGRQTIVFVDEIHRFNKAQQDAFLPHVEAGTFTLIGATTENPSFSVISALLSRCRVFVLEPLSDDHLRSILARAITETSGEQLVELDSAAEVALVQYADGDARKLLTAWETVARLAANQSKTAVTTDDIKEAIQYKHVLYDKTGEEHYNLISALHKSVRDSDPQGAVYWLTRMLESGEDPLFLARRLARAAAEDIGLADPQALILAESVFGLIARVGMPESNLFLTELAVYLALAPKSNALYVAYDQARTDVAETANQPVPLHLRNAPTKLMKELNYGKGYKYAHDFENAEVNQSHLPDSLAGRTYYWPIRGWEKQTSATKESSNPGKSKNDALPATKPKPKT